VDHTSYLQPEPLASRDPQRLVGVNDPFSPYPHAPYPPYAYALNNPMFYTDPDGFEPPPGWCDRNPVACPLPNYCDQHPEACNPPMPPPQPPSPPPGTCSQTSSIPRFTLCSGSAFVVYAACKKAGGDQATCKDLAIRAFRACMGQPDGPPPP
jgi:hypothetical protein